MSRPRRRVPSPLPIEPFLRPLSGCHGLLDAIAEEPEAEDLRLVLADWLEEHGDDADRARAELIRVQCQLAGLSAWDVERGPLQRRAEKLLQENRRAWLAGLSSEVTWGLSNFERGLLERIRVRPSELQTALNSELVQTFDVRHFRLYEAGYWGPPVGSLVPRLLTALTTPGLGGLVSLDLEGAALGDQGLRQLMSQPEQVSFERLSGLGLARTGLTAQSALLLTSTPALARLTALDLGGNALGPAGAARTLASASVLAGLTSLDLRSSGIGDAGVQSLAASANLTRLEVLNLGWNEITRAGAQALANSPALSGLNTLVLSSNVLGDDGVRALATSSHLPQLRTLILSHNGITAEGVWSLANSPLADSLTTLGLVGNPIGLEGIEGLAQTSRLTHLAALEVSPGWGGQDWWSPAHAAVTRLRKRWPFVRFR